MPITTPYVFTAGDDATSTRLNTRSSAIAELQSPPRCHAFQAAAQSIPNGAATAVLLDTEQVDTDGIHSTAVNTSRMTIVTPGRYRCIAQASFTSNATGRREVQLTRNGSLIAIQRLPTVSGSNTNIQVTNEILCVAGDYIEMVVEQNSGGALNMNTGSNGTYLHVAWVGLV
jgi:hypothetical protein